ncbi:unnamed protein product [Notodromas monacha]|uniref:Cilium assembly protein DZIP1 N-terminal domain-containing protein n=1 Tax=Notodromas monacha TaxID=399045 RepID=A0A7R9BF48_9CRUS|nr:unnamed protein product [Notodromas monacha]CAG0914247.1 unnamed protein product [Notodromas monacha]
MKPLTRRASGRREANHKEKQKQNKAAEKEEEDDDDDAERSTSSRNEAVFQPRARTKRVDWRKLGSVDPAALSRLCDVAELQAHLSYVTFCDAEAEFGVGSTSGGGGGWNQTGTAGGPGGLKALLKLFRLAQLGLEYLLRTQDALATGLDDLAANCRRLQADKDRLLDERQRLQTELMEKSSAQHPACTECFERSKLAVTQQEASSTRGFTEMILPELQALRRDLDGLRATVAAPTPTPPPVPCRECVERRSSAATSSFDPEHFRHLLSTELEMKLSRLLSAKMEQKPSTSICGDGCSKIQSVATDLREQMGELLSCEIGRVQKLVSDQHKWWTEKLGERDAELVGDVRKEMQKKIEETRFTVDNPVYGRMEQVLQQVLTCQQHQEAMLKQQEADLRLLNANKRLVVSPPPPPPAQLPVDDSLTSSRQNLTRSYEEIGWGDHHQQQQSDVSPILPHPSSSTSVSTAGVEGEQEKSKVEKEEEDDGRREERKGKGGRKVASIFKSIRRSLRFRSQSSPSLKSNPHHSGTNPPKAFATSTPRKNKKEEERIRRRLDDGDELVGHWWERDDRVNVGSKRLLNMAQWARSASTLSLPQPEASHATQAAKFKDGSATIPRSGKKTVSFLDDQERDRKSSQHEEEAEDVEEEEEEEEEEMGGDSEEDDESVARVSMQPSCSNSSAPFATIRPVPTPRSVVIKGTASSMTSWDSDD